MYPYNRTTPSAVQKAASASSFLRNLRNTELSVDVLDFDFTIKNSKEKVSNFAEYERCGAAVFVEVTL
jgi:hypothetical protein